MNARNLTVTALAALCALTGALALTAAPALALTNPERTYEMVSPPYKGGYGANGIEATATSGERVVFASRGAFAGAPGNPAIASFATDYVASRGASGWSTASIQVPAALSPEGLNGTDYSPTLESVLGIDLPGVNAGNADDEADERQVLSYSFDSPDVAANWRVLGTLKALNDHPHLIFEYQGASADFSDVVFSGGEEEPLLPDAEKSTAPLYELVSGSGESSLRLVAVQNKVGANGEPEPINPYCQAVLGFEGPKSNMFNAVSSDGEEIFFTLRASVGGESVCDDTQHQLFVRVNGEKTVEVSAPLAADCTSGPCLSATPQTAEFEGANEAGSIVYFVTSEPLVTGDTDGARDLYMARIGCPGGAQGCAASAREVTSLAQVSHDPNAGQPAEVQNVVAVSPDGSRVYFVARGVLDEGANAEGVAPVAGADNLYVYDSAMGGAPVFVADVCSGAEASGEARDSRCPSDLSDEVSPGGNRVKNDTRLWAGESEAQTSGGDGAFLLFSSYARLVVGDTDDALDVYRYDAETGRLNRVSLGEGGYGANGNADDTAKVVEEGYENADATIPGLRLYGPRYRWDGAATRAISEDGSRVVFKSAQALSPAAVNGLPNIYEWHLEPGSSEGKVSLISSGTATEPDEDQTISPSGRDIFFKTNASLVPQDVDTAPDIYDARLGGGFPVVAAAPQPCSGDACQGPLTNPAPLLVPGSVSQAPGENLASPPATVAPKPKPKSKQCKKGFVKKKNKCIKKAKAKKASRDRRTKS